MPGAARLILAALLACPFVHAGEAEDHFEAKVRPILAAKCLSCHSDAAKQSKGGLKLDSRAAMLKGGESGPALVPGKPADSLILMAARGGKADVSAMPPKGEKLSAAELAALERWIGSGAPYPGPAVAKPDPLKHWAYVAPKPQQAPAVKLADWPQTRIDRFLLTRMEKADLAPGADAQAHAVARRLSSVLVGLPPSLSELDAFLADADKLGLPKAVERYADLLLASPHFGERWARHWMDVVRYADSAGHEYDYRIPGAWRYRDYLVRAFNADVPFDRLIREHVAGDLVGPRIIDGRDEGLLGTMFWNLGEMASSPVDLANDEAERMDNRIDVLGRAFTGLTLGCARCHDHKTEPVAAKEYYGVFGVAAATPAARLWANAPALEAKAAELRAVRDRFDARVPEQEPVKVAAINPGKGKLFADFAEALPEGWKLFGHAETVDAASARRRGLDPGLWSGTLSRELPALLRSPQFVVQHPYLDLLVSGDDSTAQAVVGNFQQIREPLFEGLRKPTKPGWRWLRFDLRARKGRRAHVELFTGTADSSHQILDTHGSSKHRWGVRAAVFSDGELPPLPELDPPGKPTRMDAESRQAIEAIEKTIPQPERFFGVTELAGADAPIYARGDATKPKAGIVPRRAPVVWADTRGPYTSGSGRKELADAIASPNNPLTARVFVNRLWHHAFGRGLVPTCDNFGLSGEMPSHPELLDDLAIRFVTQHSWSVKAALREMVTSRTFRLASGPAPEADASNSLLTHYPMRRLDAEAIRDAILVAAGSLDAALGGEPIPVPHKLERSASDSGNNIPPSGPDDGNRRRSIYLATWRNVPNQFLDLFDKPVPQNAFGRRDVSQVPAQALALLNDPLVVGQAKLWGEKLAASSDPPEARVRAAYRAAFARKPTDAESKRLLGLASSGPDGWADVALAIFNAKEFIHVP